MINASLMWRFANFGSLQQSKGKQQAGISKCGGKVGDLGIIVVSSEPPDIGVKVGGGSGANPGGSTASDDEILDALQRTFDYVGLVPGFGEPADFFSAVISFGRGDYVGVTLSLAAMIPVVGVLATYAKFGRKALPKLSQSTLSTFLRSATTAGRGGVTPAGRALQKHAARPGSAFAGLASAGNAAQNARAGEAALRDILGRGNVFSYRHQVFGDVVDVKIPNGRGARFSAAGDFIGFLEP